MSSELQTTFLILKLVIGQKSDNLFVNLYLMLALNCESDEWLILRTGNFPSILYKL